MRGFNFDLISKNARATFLLRYKINIQREKAAGVHDNRPYHFVFQNILMYSAFSLQGFFCARGHSKADAAKRQFRPRIAI